MPVVSGILPISGTTAGGTSVVISGQYFLPSTTVTVGGVAAASVTYTSDTSITAVTPATVTPGTVDVRVTTSGGTSVNTSADDYTYTAPVPTVTSVTPTSGTTMGGTPVTITGTGFITGTTVKFGTLDATSVTLNSATSITAVSPETIVAGKVDITVTTTGGTSVTSGTGDDYTFTAPAPTVTSLNPTSGSTNGGTTVTVIGTGFVTGATVTFGSLTATSVSVTSPTSMTVVSPATIDPGTVSVVVTTPGGDSTPAGAQGAPPQPGLVESPSVTVLTGLTAPVFEEEMRQIVQGKHDFKKTVISAEEAKKKAA